MIWLTLKNKKGARMQTNLLNDKGKNHTISLILDFVCLHLLEIHLLHVVTVTPPSKPFNKLSQE